MNLNDAQSLAADLMQQHKLPREWSFGFDRSKVRFGKCDYGKKRISLSRHLVEANGIAVVRETILHEIAHALAPRRRPRTGLAIARPVDRLQWQPLLRQRSRATQAQVPRHLPRLPPSHLPPPPHRHRLRQVRTHLRPQIRLHLDA